MINYIKIFFLLLIFALGFSINKLDHLPDHKGISWLYLPRSEYVKFLYMDFDTLGADLYWIKGLLAFGRNYYERNGHSKELYKLLILKKVKHSLNLI